MMNCVVRSALVQITKYVLFIYTIHVVSGSTDPPFETGDLNQYMTNLSQGVQHVIQQISSVLDRQDASQIQISKLVEKQEELQQQVTQMSQQQETLQRRVSELLDSQNNSHLELTTLLHQQQDKLNQNMQEVEKISHRFTVTSHGTGNDQGTEHFIGETDLTSEILDIKGDLSNVLDRTTSLQSLILRLEDGRNNNEGRVEVFYNGEWGGMCGKNWTDDDARVVCRQLGLPSENAQAKSQSYFGEGSGRFHFKYVSCNGNENTLWSCRRNQDARKYCLSSAAVGVACHSIRLVNESDNNEGRIEVWHGDQWKGVCGRDWDDNDAKVVCRQLHLPYEGATALAEDNFGRSTDRSMLQGFSCDGSEKNLLVCGHREADVQETCEHAGVICQTPIRLVDRQNDYEGTVEVWYDDKWEKICGENWNNEEAVVVCRQLNLPSEAALGRYSRERTVLDFELAGFECSGEELSLAACNHRGWTGTKQCAGLLIASVSCQPIRLVNGSSKYDGRVEGWRDGQWGSVCDEDFDINDTTVVCRNLGLSYENALTKPGAFFGEGNGPVWFHQVNCNGSESKITQCEHSEVEYSGCNHSRDVGVVCGSSIRLEGGIDYHEGRVEVWHRGEWGTVCQISFGSQDGAVVCRELQLPYHNPEILYGSYFGEGQGRIWMSSLDCQGFEESLTSCVHRGWGEFSSQCNHTNDAGVRCELPIRLVNGNNAYEGRVEIWNHEEESWGSVCDSKWRHENAKVVCRQLGLSYDNVEIKTGAYFGKGTGPVWLHNVNCTGAETSLWSCNNGVDKMNTCDHSRDVGVVCKPLVRLAGGDSNYEGRVEIWNGDSGWGFVCNDSWNQDAARVVCRQLLLPFANPTSAFSDSIIVKKKVLYDLTECRGTEENILSCRNNGWRIGQCASGFANVTCEAPLRLIDHGSADFFKAGRVLVWESTALEWGTVHAFGWDENDARVICRQLGFLGNFQPLTFTSRGTTEPVWMNYVACNGTEDNIWSCPHTVPDVGFGFRYDAGVMCESYNNRVRLVDGKNNRKGRVEVHLAHRDRYNSRYDNWTSMWGVVCQQGWDDSDAKVACRELNLPFQNAKARKVDFESNIGASFIYNLECTGNEANLLSCPHEQGYDDYCDRVAAVVCQ